MSVFRFDSMIYVDDLIKVGVSEPQAKVQSRALTRAIDEVVSGELATKSDIFALRTELMATEVRLIKWTVVSNLALLGFLVAFFKFSAQPLL